MRGNGRSRVQPTAKKVSVPSSKMCFDAKSFAPLTDRELSVKDFCHLLFLVKAFKVLVVETYYTSWDRRCQIFFESFSKMEGLWYTCLYEQLVFKKMHDIIFVSEYTINCCAFYFQMNIHLKKKSKL